MVDLIRQHAALNLVEAKSILDAFAELGRAEIVFQDRQRATSFVREANVLGVIARLQDE